MPRTSIASALAAVLLLTAIGCFEDTPQVGSNEDGAADGACVCGWEVLGALEENGPPVDFELGTARGYDLEVAALTVDSLLVSPDQAVTVTWETRFEAIPCSSEAEVRFDSSGRFIQRVTITREGSAQQLELASIERELAGGETANEEFVIQAGTLVGAAGPVEHELTVRLEPLAGSPLEDFPLLQCNNEGDALTYGPTSNDAARATFTVAPASDPGDGITSLANPQ